MVKKPDVSQNSRASFCEIRTNDDGTLDEVIAKGADIHIEQLSENQWWIGIDKDDEHQRVVFYTDRAHIAGFTESD